ncbi:restriction endonuclease subunit S [Acinetobacter faecalis]|uniref:restriction endonuclease subunit S n=1 Tax=Acinetobacter faecalis TaxID=2665161 RepID=UPI00387E6A5E
MVKYQQYAEYKDSGVQWIGEIPQTWSFLRGKWKFRSLKEVNRNLQCMERLALTLNGVIERSIDSDEGLQPAEFSGYQIFEKNDLVFKLIDLENFKTSRVGLVFKRGIMSPAYIRLQPFKDTDSKFFYYFYFDLYLRGIYNQIGGQGVRSALNATDLLEIEVCVPTVSEQRKIANFLDYETAKIDSLIEKQQQLIQLLKEKRQAVISHAVTKGLNPNVPMKDSGVEWLGEVPEHWNTLPLKLCVQTRKGVAFKAVDFCDAGIRVVKASDIKQKTIRESETFLPNSYVNEFPKAVLHTDDLILSTVGSTPDVKNSAVGQIGKVPQSLSGSLLNQNTVVFSSTEILDQNFLYYLVQTNSYRDHLDLNAHGTANQASLNISDMLNFMISIPELNEQVEIKNYLDKKISKLEELELKILAMSISLNERRTALISAAVTGKIDVRNWQNPTEAKMEFSA